MMTGFQTFRLDPLSRRPATSINTHGNDGNLIRGAPASPGWDSGNFRLPQREAIVASDG
jgi:hypothetical protein